MYSLYLFKFFYKIFNLETYPISEDSIFLLKSSYPYAFGNVLELCSGSGFVGILLSFKKEVNKVYLYDIDKEAIIISKINSFLNNSNKIKIFNESIKEKFDLIIFNPPYLPKDEYYEILKDKTNLWTVGGEEGIEVTMDLINKYKSFLKEKGKIIFIQSSLSNIKKLESLISKEFNFKIIDKLDFGEEILYSYLLWKK